jgi:hypothetical protein
MIKVFLSELQNIENKMYFVWELDMITYCGVFDEILIVQNNMPGAVEVF